MHALLEPPALEDRFGAGSDGGHDIGLTNGSLGARRGLDRNIEAPAQLRCQRLSMFWVAAPDADPAERPDGGDRIDVGSRLDAGAEDGQLAGITPGEQVGGHPRHGRRTDGGDGRAVHQGGEASSVRFEEQHRALVGIDAALGVAGEDGHGLHAERAFLSLKRRDIARHQTEEATHPRNPHDGPQGDQRLSSGERRQRVTHHLNAFGHRQESRHFLAVEHQDVHQATAAWIREATSWRSSFVR